MKCESGTDDSNYLKLFCIFDTAVSTIYLNYTLIKTFRDLFCLQQTKFKPKQQQQQKAKLKNNLKSLK